MTDGLRREVMFSRLAAALTRSGHEDFMEILVAELARILDVEYVLIAEVVPGSNEAHTKAVYGKGRILDNFSYPLRGTPCETVPEREVCYYSEAVAEQFPDDQLLADLGIQSYVGMPVLTPDGIKIGLLSAMAERAYQIDAAGREVMQIAAAQVGADFELARNHRRIRALTYEDMVTGLPNREKLGDFLSEHATAPFLLLVDLRRFKDVNDLHGHRTGDAVLFAAAERLRERLDGRGFIARWSGDEFALVPNEHWQGGVMDMVEQAHTWFLEPVACGQTEFQLEITIGAACAAEDAARALSPSGNELVRRASVALADAKARNLGFALFEPAMVDQRQLSHAMFAGLLRALRQDELQLHYQPQFDLDSGELVGAEVLCRWHDDALGWVAPSTFIPLAEERGLMGELGDWVLANACQQLTLWERQGRRFPGKLSVNVSSKQLEDLDFAERAASLLCGQGASRVVLELTESAMMRSPDASLAQMQLLRRKGFAWAVDDFGTGYSSLAYLTKMDAAYLKIDRSFVARVPGSKHDESLIRTIIAMGRTMEMELIAEGIETETQRDYLRAIGCRYGQGYLLGEPVSADVFAARWLSLRD